MGKELSEDEIEEILDLYEETGSLDKVEDELDYSIRTVRKYVKKAWRQGDERVKEYRPKNPEPGEEFGSGEPDTLGEGESVFSDPRKEVANELAKFFKKICDNTRLKYDVVKFFVIDDVKEVRDIPNGSQLFRLIIGGNTGVSNEEVTQKIVEKYQRYVNGNEIIARHLNEGSITIGSEMWSKNNAPGGGIPGAPGQMGQGGRSVGVGGGPPHGPGPRGHQQNPSTQQPMTAKDVADIAAEAAKETVRSSNETRTEEPSSIEERLGKRILDKEVEKLERELVEGRDDLTREDVAEIVQAVIQSNEDQGRGVGRDEGWRGFPESSSPAVQVAWLVDNTQMKHEEAKEFVEQNEDPEVLEMKFKKDKFERRNELAENIVNDTLDTLERLAGDWDKKIGDSIYDNLTSQSEEEGEERRQPAETEAQPVNPQQQQARTAGVEQTECPECGGPAEAQGDIMYCNDPECGYGVDKCDLCAEEIELPPVGEAGFFLCGGDECKEVLEAPGEPGGEVECTECGWEGSREDSPHEFTECDSCGRHRPIARTQAELADIHEAGLNNLWLEA